MNMINWVAMATVVYLHGKNGRMGQAVQAVIQNNSAFTLSGSADECDVVIDFSSPSSLTELLKMKKPLVIGTTGYGEEEKRRILEASKVLPIFMTPNFSLGMTLLRQMVQELAERVGGEIEIVEAHNKNKKDKPSGSALLIEEELGKDVPIHSIRAGDIVGDHTVIFGLDGERLEIKHQVHSRAAFAHGALKAAQFIKSQPPGLYAAC
jgi:4-hydroxy-tetrahydrodipicolinate reductase